MKDFHGISPMNGTANDYLAYCVSLDYPDFSTGGIVPDFSGGIVPDFGSDKMP